MTGSASTAPKAGLTDIDWRATRLQTSQGSLAVIPNSLAAKAKIVNFSRPADMFGLTVSLQVSPHVRPQTVIEALERAMQGCRAAAGQTRAQRGVQDFLQ